MEFKYDDILWELNDGPWWDWKDPRNKVYENLIVKEGFEKPTKKFLDDKLKKKQSEYDAKKYQRDRLTEYPSIQELVVALYDESDKQALIDKRNAVKAKYPKPE